MEVQELYEAFPFPLSGSHHDFLDRLILPNIPNQPEHILDAGCGTGNLSAGLAKAFPRSHVTGIDFSNASLQAARSLAEERGIANLEFHRVDLMNGFGDWTPPQPFDFAVSIGCLHHTPDPAAGLRTIRSAMVAGKRLIIVVYGKYGRIETEMRRRLMCFFRDKANQTSKQLLSLVRALESESVFRANRFGKSRAVQVLLKDPWRFARIVRSKVMSKLRLRMPSDTVPWEIGVADQYLHPLVQDWDADRWIQVIQSNGFEIERFIYDPSPVGDCIPEDPLAKVKSPELRELLSAMHPNDRYVAMDLLFRPALHVLACTAA